MPVLAFIAGLIGVLLNSHVAFPDERLIQGAKNEGGIVWYSGTPEGDAKAFIADFEKKYAGIKVSHYRASAPVLVTRIQTEQRAGRFAWDVYSSTGFEGYVLFDQGYFAAHNSPERRHFPDGYKDHDGYWTSMYTTLNVINYNTRLLSPSELPREYFDLIHPKWKGKLGLSSQEVEWYSNLKKIWGSGKTNKFFSGLVQQNIGLRVGRGLLTDLLTAGEFSVLVNNFHQNVIRTKRMGAPLEFVALDFVIAGAAPVAINRHAPHPNAARLFVDFALSREGQQILVKQGRASARNDVTGNLLDEFRENKKAKVIPSDLALGKMYAESRKEFESLLGISAK